MVNKVPDPSPLKKSNAPAVFVFVGEAASRGKTGKAEHNVGRYIAVHAEQLAHDGQTELREDAYGITKLAAFRIH
jgi:hypothetical protein